MIGEIFEDGEGGHGENLLFAHQAHGLIAQLIGMVDRCDSRLRRIQRAWFAGGMHRDALARARGFLHRGRQFRFGVLIRRGKLAVAHGIRAGLVNLDEVRALLDLLRA